MTPIPSFPQCHFFTCGAAEGASRANALDSARLNAGVGGVNLLETGPILPPDCPLTEPLELPAGELVPAIIATITSDVPGEVISAGVAAAYPAAAGRAGVVMSYAGAGHKEDIEAIARRLAAEALAARGLETRDLRSIAVQHRVESIGTAFAAVVLWSGSP